MIDLGKWSFIPGPEEDPPVSSLYLQDLIEYPPEQLIGAVLRFPDMRILNSGAGDWWKWRAEWNLCDRRIGVGMTLFDVNPISWGGSPLQGVCEIDDILDLWNVIRVQCPGVWMQNSDCDIHTPESFRRLFEGE